jgi:hypothetical protein
VFTDNQFYTYVLNFYAALMVAKITSCYVEKPGVLFNDNSITSQWSRREGSAAFLRNTFSVN